VLSVQGDFERHIEAVRSLGAEAVEVRTPEELATVERLIAPGGESTTVGMLMRRFGLDQAIRERAASGMPVWGTCMGLILMSTEVEGREQPTLGLLDVTVRRNAFGAQVHSFEDSVKVAGIEGTVQAVFIRAPVVTRLGPGVESLAEYGGEIVAVRHGALLGTSFHPELTDDRRMHEWFLGF
jgi:pyridoxal 5'-phosphate synthase pdxT subunit